MKLVSIWWVMTLDAVTWPPFQWGPRTSPTPPKIPSSPFAANLLPSGPWHCCAFFCHYGFPSSRIFSEGNQTVCHLQDLMFFHWASCFEIMHVPARIRGLFLFIASGDPLEVQQFVDPVAWWWAFGLFPIFCFYQENFEWIFACKSLRGQMLTFPLGTYLRVRRSWL